MSKTCSNCNGRGYMWAISVGTNAFFGPHVPGRSCSCAAGKKRQREDRENNLTRECHCVPNQILNAIATLKETPGEDRVVVPKADPDCMKCGEEGKF